MLLQFAVEKVVLSLLTVPGEDHPQGQVVDVPGIGPVLRSVGIYGANASGKSNLLRAFEAAWSLSMRGVGPGKKLPVRCHSRSGWTG